MRKPVSIAIATLTSVLLVVLVVGPVGPSPIAHSAFPGYNGKIAMFRGGEVWTINPDGTDLKKFAGGEQPAWSADGLRLAYSSAWNIWVSDADGSNATQLTNGEYDVDPAWSPDGTKIAFGSYRDQRFGIFIVDVASREVSYLTENTSVGLNGGPVWSPDGTQIAHADSRGVRITNVDGSADRVLTITKGNAPAWSPDGGRIAFRALGSNVDIFVVNVDGTNEQQLTNTDFNEDDLAWSPDGTRIVYAAFDYSFGQQLWMMRADGSGQTQLTFGGNDAFSREPDWQPLTEDPGFAPFPLASATATPTPSPTAAELPPTGAAADDTSSSTTTVLLFIGITLASIAVPSTWLAIRLRSMSS